jgi:small conductance mechanosensitive channel
VIAEDIVFDKAEQAEKRAKEKKELIGTIEKLESSLKDAPEEDKGRIKKEIAEGRERLKVLEQAAGESPRDEDTPEASASTDADKPRD